MLDADGALRADIADLLRRTRFAGARWAAQVTSTNDEVAALARAGAPEGAAVVADWQSAGRGRRGRSWEAPPGSSLLVSVLLRPPAPQAHLAVMAAGLAAVEACLETAGVEAGLKWPNDVVVPEGKLGGILAELHAGAVVVGLGLNVDWSVPMPAGAACLSALAGRPVDRGALLAAYLGALHRRWDDEPGALGDAWRERCTTIGQAVRVELADRTLEGVATGVTADGRLLVDGVVVAAGDVVHLRPGVCSG